MPAQLISHKPSQPHSGLMGFWDVIGPVDFLSSLAEAASCRVSHFFSFSFFFSKYHELVSFPYLTWLCVQRALRGAGSRCAVWTRGFDYEHEHVANLTSEKGHTCHIHQKLNLS